LPNAVIEAPDSAEKSAANGVQRSNCPAAPKTIFGCDRVVENNHRPHADEDQKFPTDAGFIQNPKPCPSIMPTGILPKIQQSHWRSKPVVFFNDRQKD
jgi:hypothetical protein